MQWNEGNSMMTPRKQSLFITELALNKMSLLSTSNLASFWLMLSCSYSYPGSSITWLTYVRTHPRVIIHFRCGCSKPLLPCSFIEQILLKYICVLDITHTCTHTHAWDIHVQCVCYILLITYLVTYSEHIPRKNLLLPCSSPPFPITLM